MSYQKIAKAIIFFMSMLMAIIAQAAPVTSLTTVTSVGLAPPMNVNSLLPVVNNDSSANAQIISLMFRPLIWIGTDLKINWSQSIAQSINVSANRREFTIRLKSWRWSDGRLVTAEDVLKCLHMIQAFGPRYANSGMGGIPDIITKAVALNKQTLKIYVKRPVNPLWFELNGLSQLIPVPAWRWSKYSVDTLFKLQDEPQMVSVVDGPYKLEQYNPGRSIDFIKNKAYSGKPASLEHLRFKRYTADSSAFWALKSGIIQAGMIPHYLYGARWMVKGLKTCISNGGYGFNYVTLNFTNPKVKFLKNVKVRQALALAINQTQMIKVAFHGLGVPSFNPVPSNPDTYLSPAMKALVANPELAYNPEKAKRLLDDAGWRPGPGGIRVRHGQTLMFTMLVPDISQTLIAVSELLQTDWKDIGVDMRIRMSPFNLELAKLHPHGKWQSAMIVWSYDPDYYPSGDGIFNTGGGTNYGGYSNSTMDRLIRDSTDKNGLDALFKYEDYVHEQVPDIFLPYPEYIVKYSPGINRKQLDNALYDVSCRTVESLGRW